MTVDMLLTVFESLIIDFNQFYPLGLFDDI